jgi:hypothetical protein
MYGLGDYYVAREIIRIMNEGSDDEMDPTLNSLAHRLRHEMLAEATASQPNQSERIANLRQRLGGLQVTLGQRMQATSEEKVFPCLENEACA